MNAKLFIKSYRLYLCIVKLLKRLFEKRFKLPRQCSVCFPHGDEIWYKSDLINCSVVCKYDCGTIRGYYFACHKGCKSKVNWFDSNAKSIDIVFDEPESKG